MQTGKVAAASLKESAGNVAASAMSGMEKTKATVQGKMEKAGAHTAAEKEMARERKEEKINEAEMKKREVCEVNADAKKAALAGSVVSSNQTRTLMPGHLL